MFVRTQRLLLRPFWEEDAPTLARTIADWDIVRMLATAPWPYRLEDAQSFIAKMEAGDPKSVFALFALDQPETPLVGCMGFGANQSGAVQEVPSFGMWIAKDHWGQGYGLEGATAVLDVAFFGLKLETMEASYYHDNPASAELLTCAARGAAVMTHEMTLPAARWIAQRRGQRAYAGARLAPAHKKADADAELGAARWNMCDAA
jgi:RimJ/RimL family protein N-acetyltransferase